jgi:hypothetical protein
LRGQDLNLRPSGYEPDELPGCSTPRQECLSLSPVAYFVFSGFTEMAGRFTPRQVFIGVNYRKKIPYPF